MRYTVPAVVLLQLMTASSAYALSSDVNIVGTQEAQVPLHSSLATVKRQGSDAFSMKKIQLMKVELSPAAQANLATLVESDATSTDLVSAKIPSSDAINMSRFAVLDQGQHGTCVTFANTGALDVVENKSDYFSQLCNLELGSTLKQQDARYPSGWDGSYTELVLKQIEDYGVITKSYQQQYGCAGKFDYPAQEQNDTGTPMTVEDFTQHSEKVMQTVSYKMLLTIQDAYSGKADRKALLPLMKQAINNGHPVVVSFLLDTNYAYVGAVGKYKTDQDSWIMTPDIAKDVKKDKVHAGHAVIITAYDDNAVIMGPKHTKHVGVITLRNSWTTMAGDQGNYYMSYDYFKKLITELAEVGAK